jgi:hypothetical protein
MRQMAGRNCTHPAAGISLRLGTIMTLEHWCWLATLAYAGHIVEEFALDWRGWVKSVSGIEVSRRVFWTMNALVIVLGAICASAASRWPAVALAFPALMLINATVFHVGTFLWKRGRFSPGLITSYLLFYPIGILCFKAASDAGVLTPAVWIGSFAIGALLMATPILLLKAKEMRYFRQSE